jgi:hypothetical protein
VPRNARGFADTIASRPTDDAALDSLLIDLLPVVLMKTLLEKTYATKEKCNL